MRSGDVVRQRIGPGGIDLRLRASEEAGADLHRTRAERERGRHAARIGNASGGDDRHTHRVDDGRQQGEESDELSLRALRVERGAMAAGFRALHDDRIRAGVLGDLRFGERGHDREPRDASVFDSRDVLGREHTHHGGDDGRIGFQQRVTLSREVRRCRVARLGRNRRPPVREERANTRLVLRGRGAAADRAPRG